MEFRPSATAGRQVPLARWECRRHNGFSPRKSGPLRLIATGLAVLAAASFALPANASEGNAVLYSGANQSGTKSPVDLANDECVNTPPVRSGVNISSADIDVFYGANCSGSSYYVLGSLHQGTFPFPALSYRVR